MAVLLLVLFPFLLMYNARAAFVSLAVAIVLLYRARTGSKPRSAPRYVSDDSSI
jgi:hypothetical protein